jgi:hypothetical protein
MNKIIDLSKENKDKIDIEGFSKALQQVIDHTVVFDKNGALVMYSEELREEL